MLCIIGQVNTLETQNTINLVEEILPSDDRNVCHVKLNRVNKGTALDGLDFNLNVFWKLLKK